jgi:hypothetical protein
MFFSGKHGGIIITHSRGVKSKFILHFGPVVEKKFGGGEMHSRDENIFAKLFQTI